MRLREMRAREKKEQENENELNAENEKKTSTNGEWKDELARFMNHIALIVCERQLQSQH